LFFGAPVLVDAVGTSTVPTILTTIVGLLGSFVVIVIVFVCLPLLPLVLKVALIELDCPFAISESVVLTAVQPQLPFTLRISKLLFPSFLKTNSCTTLSPCFTVPKSKTFSENVIFGAFAFCSGVILAKSS